jgi:coenzyme F420-dependent glucose-6-phosphate dehydrogenase
MREALEIMRKLLDGEKVTYNGEFYKTENVKLYSPPLHKVPLYLAAGGPKSAELAGEKADGVIVSVKNVEEYKTKILEPMRQKSSQQNGDKMVVASRWTVFAKNQEEAWQALQPWRGLRAPHRDTVSDPSELQREADELPREEVLGRYTLVSSPQEYIEAYKPLITDLHANVVAIQTTTAGDQMQLINMLGKEVINQLKRL